MTTTRQVLAVANCAETVGRLEELLLSTRKATLEQVSHGVDALDRATRRHFELIMMEFPLLDLDMEDFLSELRGPESTSRESPVVVLTGSVDRRALEALGRERLSGVEIYTHSRGALRAITRRLHLSDRLRAELRVAMVGTTEDARGTQLAQTRNISVTGMLLGVDFLLPVGTIAPIAVELSSEEPPIRGGAEVVRHTDPVREKVTGMGVRFVGLLDEDRRRLSEFVAEGLRVQRL